MAGVIQEIDLQLAAAAVDKATRDAEVAGKRIGQATAQGSQAELKAAATWFDQMYGQQASQTGATVGKNLTKALQLQLDLAQADIKESLARALITPVEAERRGREAGLAFNAGLLEQMQQIGAAGGFSGSGGQSQFVALAGQLKDVDEASGMATRGMGRMRAALITLTAHATGTNTAVASLLNGLLLFSEGSVVALAIAAGIGVFILAWQKLTEATREASKEAQKYVDKIRLSNIAGLTPFAGYTHDISEARKEMEALRKEFESIQREKQQTGVEVGKGLPRSAFGTPDTQLTERQKEILLSILDIQDHINQSTNKWNKEESEANYQASETAKRARDKAAAEEKRRQAELVRLLKEEEARLLKEDEAQRTLSVEAQHALADLTVSTVDNLQLEIQAFEEKTIAAFGHITPEAQKVIDAWKLKLEQVKLLEPLDKELTALAEKTANIAKLGGVGPAGAEMVQTLDKVVQRLLAARNKLQEGTVEWAEWDKRITKVIGLQDQLLKGVGDANVGVKDFATNWRHVGKVIVDVSQGLLDMARGMGLVHDQLDKVLQGFVSIGRSIEHLKSDPLGGIVGIIGGVGSIIGGFFHPNKDPGRMADNQAWYEKAMTGDAAALDRLFAMSGHKSSAEGWATADAKADAWAKYQAVQAYLAAHPPLAVSEQAQVDARADAEARASLAATVAAANKLGGPAAAAAAAAVAAQKAADAVAASDPLGAAGPLGRDAQSRADAAKRAAEQAVAAAGGKITPGYTVQQTITQSSAGQIVGELISQTTWLAKIYGAITGTAPGGAGGGGAASGVRGQPIQLVCDGKVLASIVSQYQYGSYQDAAAKNGNAQMGG